MRDEIGIHRAAKLIIGQYGENAADFALMRSEQLIDDGEVKGAAVWQQLLVAIVGLQRERPEDETLN
jgi:hypothetical protein